jgi:energy-coupling factor transporter ATP-binding protein EcfA2
MDFYQIRSKETKEGMELYPDFIVGRSKDLMIQGRSFYAVWDEANHIWSRDEYDVQRLVDEDLNREADQLFRETGVSYTVKSMRSFNSTTWVQFKKYMAAIGDNSHQLDTKLIFANTEIKKTDYASKRLPYALGPGSIEAWSELVGTLYSVEERNKIEWAIGAIVSGEAKKIQKFVVFYGSAGTGKSTILNIVASLFEGYTATFDGKALGSSNAAFATEVFKNNPLVAIQHDGDLSRIEDNTRLNSIISHEEIVMNEKYKASYPSRINAMLFIGSNQPVKISDAKSGMLRRLIDIHPTGIKIPPKHYEQLMQQISFELGAIAHHCLEVFQSMGKNHYNAYRPTEMMLQTDVFFNFVEANYDIFKSQEAMPLTQAYSLYKEFCADTGIERPLPQYKMREELRNYFKEFKDRGEVDGKTMRSVYYGFTAEKFKTQTEDPGVFTLSLGETTSLLDQLLSDCPAQQAKADGTPSKAWKNVTTKLSDIKTSELHYVQVPENHIVIDFDLKAINGHSGLERNLEAASSWPPTYAEVSQSGDGLHLHYEYLGDASRLHNLFAEGIEVKVYSGSAALRRKLTACNAVPIAEISSGLPLKEEKKVLTEKAITSERGLRRMIERNLKKEIHAGTKPSVDFIHKVLEEAYESGMEYDVSDMRTKILAFANNSSNQAGTALKTVQSMKFSSEREHVSVDREGDERLVFFDVEVYKNLFVVCWKYQGSDEVVRMVNPSAADVTDLFRLRLVGFYCRRYDNHILYAASLGWGVERLYELSQKMIVDSNRNATFAAAYNISYADIWDFSTKRQGLKKFEIDLGLPHMELDLPWDQPVDPKDWDRVVEYCVNDVKATEAVFEDRKGDFTARQILAELSGLSINDTTQRHTAKILFGDEKNPQREFVYTDLSKEFPGYEFSYGKSTYRGEDPGEGGYVYAEPGMYTNVGVLDVASMHPATIEVLNLFGPYTQKYAELKAARIAIKRQEYAKAREMFDGRLAPFLEGAEDHKVDEHGSELAFALRIALNIVYGLTSAKFDNPFRDIRNVDNIVAKRGALFMIDLKHQLQKGGAQVVHIKTDSVKIPDVDDTLIEFVKTYGEKYGYEFEHEATYDKFVLVNDAVYVARKGDQYTCIGAQFAHPYVYKELFSHELIQFSDYCEAKSVNQGVIYLDIEGRDGTSEERDHRKMRHVGKTGSFVPVLEGGGVLYRVKDDKYYAVAGTKGHLWMESHLASQVKDLKIDMAYFEKLKDDAIKTIEKFGSFEEFVA